MIAVASMMYARVTIPSTWKAPFNYSPFSFLLLPFWLCAQTWTERGREYLPLWVMRSDSFFSIFFLDLNEDTVRGCSLLALLLHRGMNSHARTPRFRSWNEHPQRALLLWNAVLQGTPLTSRALLGTVAGQLFGREEVRGCACPDSHSSRIYLMVPLQLYSSEAFVASSDVTHHPLARDSSRGRNIDAQVMIPVFRY